jgi:hypothetical protein
MIISPPPTYIAITNAALHGFDCMWIQEIAGKNQKGTRRHGILHTIEHQKFSTFIIIVESAQTGQYRHAFALSIEQGMNMINMKSHFGIDTVAIVTQM